MNRTYKNRTVEAATNTLAVLILSIVGLTTPRASAGVCADNVCDLVATACSNLYAPCWTSCNVNGGGIINAEVDGVTKCYNPGSGNDCDDTNCTSASTLEVTIPEVDYDYTALPANGTFPSNSHMLALG